MGLKSVFDGVVFNVSCTRPKRMEVCGRHRFAASSCAIVVVLALGLSACSLSNSTRLGRPDPVGMRSQFRSAARPAIDPATGTRPSPRLVSYGLPIRKGGGAYKIGSPYKISGRWYSPRSQPRYDRIGRASWYGRDFHGRKTANGELYDLNALSAAHPTLPLPSLVYVTNLANNRTVLVRVNDRGPYAHNRIIDLSRRVADVLDFRRQGVARVRVRYYGRAPLSGDDRAERRFLAAQSWYGRGRAIRQAEAYQGFPSPKTVRPSRWWWPDTVMRGLGFGG